MACAVEIGPGHSFPSPYRNHVNFLKHRTNRRKKELSLERKHKEKYIRIFSRRQLVTAVTCPTKSAEIGSVTLQYCFHLRSKDSGIVGSFYRGMLLAVQPTSPQVRGNRSFRCGVPVLTSVNMSAQGDLRRFAEDDVDITIGARRSMVLWHVSNLSLQRPCRVSSSGIIESSTA